MTLKAAIFDWDGTITDSNNIKTEAFVELFQNACPQAAGYIREYQQNRGGISRFEKFRHYIRHFFHREVSAAELEDFGRRYAALCRQKLLNAPFIPGAVETLRKLSCAKIPVFIVTGSPNQRTRRRPQPAAADSSYIWLAANQRRSAGRTAGRKPPCSRRNGIFWRRSDRLRSRPN